ncbi:hypothetical protein VB638_05450 [Dolichospermum sp. UHCC 0684]|uniref:hypothetical protein n=1 Tax=unclassified Dolichospermum TaxID=2622029 RepID=UPI001445506B|nr:MULTISPECIES: hypothetical protein [unclassified Dolichospermum]MEA5529040.1 hypothetical protein [Dolichospermum sp. UHCC 0684]MTJ35053.1 hypothetical protein [Dolichospermum sp. UHCC 0260]
MNTFKMLAAFAIALPTSPKCDRLSFIKAILPESDRYFLTQQPQRLPQPFWDIQIRKLKI